MSTNHLRACCQYTASKTHKTKLAGAANRPESGVSKLFVNSKALLDSKPGKACLTSICWLTPLLGTRQQAAVTRSGLTSGARQWPGGLCGHTVCTRACQRAVAGHTGVCHMVQYKQQAQASSTLCRCRIACILQAAICLHTCIQVHLRGRYTAHVPSTHTGSVG